MTAFDYRDDELFCEDVRLAEIADRIGTPTYVYSHAGLTEAFQAFDAGLEPLDRLICFAVKANSNLAVLNTLFELGAGADIVSGGELHRVIKAGGDPKKVVFSGVGKTEQEMRYALEQGIKCFNVESRAELGVLNDVAGSIGRRAPVSLRVNPDVDAETHPYISTGLKTNKFGVSMDVAFDVYREAADLANIDVVGIDCHIGSQLTKIDPFAAAIERLNALVLKLADAGIRLHHIDIGGGLGVPYTEADQPPARSVYGDAVKKALAPLADMKLEVLTEPGRNIAAMNGALLTEVLFLKSNEVKNFTVVDAAFNDLLRPAFYQSYHPIAPLARRAGAEQWTSDVVGPICETGDFLARDREMPRLERGERLAFLAAGAYGFTMASNYNTRPRAAEVLVRGSEFRVVRAREQLDDLLRGESLPSW